MSSNVEGFSQANNRAFRNPWVIGWIVLVVIVLGVNITMITLAVTTNPGLVDKEYYEKGRQFERTVQQQIAARNALGWSSQLDVPSDLRRNQSETLRFSVVDKNGLPVSGLKATLASYRPSDASADFSTAMEEFAPGQYQATVGYALKGLWELTLQAEQNGQKYELIKRRINIAD